MKVNSRQNFIKKIQQFNINSEYVVVKPNWVSSNTGEYTEPEILDWLLDAFPLQKKIVVESYTPWRGLKFIEEDNQKGSGVTLEGGIKHWEFYRKQDKYFLKTTNIGNVLQKHKVDYINVTNEVWSDNCADSKVVKQFVENNGKSIKWEEFYSYIPKKLFEIRDSVTFISLSKIKTEKSFPTIMISMSVKNLFGLIPHPSRWVPFHGNNHETVPEVIKDIYTLYTTIFNNNIWITEGIKTMIENYEGSKHKVVKNKNLLYLGTSGKNVDSEASVAVGLDPKNVEHLQLIT